MVLLVIVAGLGAAAALFSFSRPNPLPLEQERRSADALAAAKEALIAYAVHRGAPKCSIIEDYESNTKKEICRLEGLRSRPGELPCPDLDGDGDADVPCSTGASLIGRLPWKTLGIPQPRGPDGETLWYALAGPFRPYDSNPLPAGAALSTDAARKHINSDTRGNISVYAPDGKVVTNSAVAVLFAPGGARGNQKRSSSLNVVCGLTGATVVATACPTEYLETVTWIAGAVDNGPFVSVTLLPRSATVNDRAMYVSTSELISAVEIRVGNELKSLLSAYRFNSTCQCYPWADNWEYSGGIADKGQNRGRLGTDVAPEPWGSGATGDLMPRLPPWIGANNWNNLIWYSVSRQATVPGTCRTCSGDVLTVGTTRVAALFFMPGTPRDGAARILPLYGSRADNLSLYLHDAANSDAADYPACRDVGDIGHAASASPPSVPGDAKCDHYVMPTSTARDRNRIYLIGAVSADSCATNAQTLMAKSPCGENYTGNAVDPACTAARFNLDACPAACATAAKTIIDEPCRNNLNSTKCENAVTALTQCGKF